MQHPTMVALRDYMHRTGERLTFAQTRAAVDLNWPDVRVKLASLAGDWLPAGTIWFSSPKGGAEILPDGTVKHAQTYNDD